MRRVFLSLGAAVLAGSLAVVLVVFAALEGWGRAPLAPPGDTDGGIWTVGQSQGLIHDIPTCQEMVANIMRQAEQVLSRNAQRVVVSA